MSHTIASLLYLFGLAIFIEMCKATSTVMLNGSVMEGISVTKKDATEEGVKIEITGGNGEALSTTLARILKLERLAVKFEDNEKYFVALVIYGYSQVHDGKFTVTCRALELEASLYNVFWNGNLLNGALAILRQEPSDINKGIMYIYGHEKNIQSCVQEGGNLSVELESISGKARRYKRIINITEPKFRGNSVSELQFTHLKPEMSVRIINPTPFPTAGICAIVLQEPSHDKLGKMEIYGKIDAVKKSIEFLKDTDRYIVQVGSDKVPQQYTEVRNFLNIENLSPDAVPDNNGKYLVEFQTLKEL